MNPKAYVFLKSQLSNLTNLSNKEFYNRVLYQLEKDMSYLEIDRDDDIY